jgi:DNA-binding PadR family transcriptional regulator
MSIFKLPKPTSTNIPATSKKLSQIRRGLLEYAVLILIESADPPMHANEIQEKLSTTEFSVSRGTLHSLLARLCRQKLIENTRDLQDEGFMRKCYYLTSNGRKLLNELNYYWKILNLTLKSLNSPR